MSRLHLSLLLVLSIALSGTLFAKDHDDKRHDRDRDHDRDRRIHIRHDHDRDHDRRREGRVHEEHGKKTGWGDCDAPPGQAKKEGCHAHPEHHVRVSHHRREREHHRTVVRHDHDRDRDRHRRTAAVPVRTNTATAPRPEPITRNPNAHPGAGVAGGADAGHRAPVKTVQQ